MAMLKITNSLFQAEIFQEFTIREDLVGFQVSLTVLLDCLNIFGGTTVPGKYKGNLIVEWIKNLTTCNSI